MSLQAIRDYYQVPATQGQRIRYNGGFTPTEGTIMGAKDTKLLVDFGAEVGEYLMHPTWQIQYL